MTDTPTIASAPMPTEPPSRARRERTTRRSVIIVDKIADIGITVGGLGVIAAVFGIMLFLAEVVVPLFTGGHVVGEVAVEPPSGAAPTVMRRIDEYKSLSVAIDADGSVRAFHIGSGTPVSVANVELKGARITAVGRTLSGENVALGFADGSVRFGKVDLEARVLRAGDVPANLKAVGTNDRTDGQAVYAPLPGDQVRRTSVSVAFDDPQEISPGKNIVAIDYRYGGTVERPTRAFVTVDSAGVARLSRAESKKNLLTGGTRTVIQTATLAALPAGTQVAGVLMTETADQVYIVDRGGTLYRYDTRDFEKPVLAETRDLFDGDVKLATFGFLIGEQSIVATGSNGAVNVYFRLQRPDAGTKDGYALVLAHALERHKSPVVAFAASQRGKVLATADADGGIWLRNSTSEQTLLRLRLPKDAKAPVEALSLAPRDDAVTAYLADGRVRTWHVAVPHPESSWKAIFGKIWYEGYDRPEYTWQSSSGTDSFEPKFSLVPLIFGTLKATLYSLLFAIPVALLAAIYTSEFVHHSVRAAVKPAMEMMASLPSVVLGFIAALILAPLVETWIAAVILAFVVIPGCLLGAAFLWQLLPLPIALRFGGLPKFSLMFVALGIAGFVAYGLGPSFEGVFFDGDLRAWANGDIGSDVPFLFLLLLPAALAVVSSVAGQQFDDRLRALFRDLPRPKAGGLDALRFVGVLLASAMLAYLLAFGLDAIGIAARGGVVDTYVQRNTLVVGFAMGFAVIPIIYTIAEDALNSVPEHLRAASLACGATPWQTAVRVILPTAMSGVFAAVMVGMGRAVGETMIVVMAAGNTPLLEWNIFNGLRALSANIAVELPEAVKDGTLYRMLFLAGMTLFIMTFVVNTLAEVVRLRFRRRAAQL